MLDHMVLAVSNLERSLAFYEAALKPLDIEFFLPYKGEGDRRAGLRTDQGAARFSALQPARTEQCSPRMETGVPGVQSAQAVRFRMDAKGRLTSRREAFSTPSGKA
jgi:catechol 2,3-dioxygenase-like lactoylglutathione lyase family enzyme